MLEELNKLDRYVSITNIVGKSAPYSPRAFLCVYSTRFFPLSLVGMCAVIFFAWYDGLETFSAGVNASMGFVLYGLFAAPLIETLLLAVLFNVAHITGLLGRTPKSDLLLCVAVATLFSLAHGSGPFARYLYLWLLGLLLAIVMCQHWSAGHRQLGLVYTWLAHQLFNATQIGLVFTILKVGR